MSAATLRASSSRPMSYVDLSPHTNAMSYESFKPKFPLDPFADMNFQISSREPWNLDVDALPLPSTSQSQRNIVLVIGDPPQKVLEPLFHSPHLASSLLILATHKPQYRPPFIPANVQPAVRVLRLAFPLAIENAGATHLVEVLEWAERVARVWRRHGGSGVQELPEIVDPTKDATVRRPSSMFRAGTASALPTPQSSQNDLLNSTPPTSFSRSQSSKYLSKARPHQKPEQALSLPPPDPAQRSFDAILNFLPPNLPDKALLKHAILVTTITRPYLVADSPGFGLTPGSNKSRKRLSQRARTDSPRRWSWLSTSVPAPGEDWSQGRDRIYSRSLASRSRGGLDSPPSTMPSLTSLSELSCAAPVRTLNARIIHLLPSTVSNNSPAYSLPAQTHAHAKLIRSIEAFLLSFWFPPSLSGDPAPRDPGQSRARPYVLHAATFADVISTYHDGARTTEWSLAEIILSGALDLPSAPEQYRGDGGVAKGKGRETAAEWKARRAWIAGVSDIVLSSAKLQPTPPSKQPRPTAAAPDFFLAPAGPPRIHTAPGRLPTAADAIAPPYLPSIPPGAMPPSTARRGAPWSAKRRSSGLPTPPDSDEASVEPGDGSYHWDAQADADAERAAAEPPRARSESDPNPVCGATAAARVRQSHQLSDVVVAGTAQALQKRRSRWKFWKTGSRARSPGEV